MRDRHATAARRQRQPQLGGSEHLSRALAEFDLADYVARARADGRVAMSPRLRAEACALYTQVVAFRRANTTIPRALDDVLELAERVLFSEWFLSQSKFPRYRAYTNMAVLNWCLGTHRRTPYQEIWTRCAAAIRVLLRDVLAFEADSLAGLETRGADSFDRDAVLARVAQLESISAVVAGSDAGIEATPSAPLAPPAAWQGYLADSDSGPTLALVYLTSFPLTREHDEYMFLRTLHISECCFWAILTAALAAVECLKHENAALAERCLAVALPFAELLTPMIRALKTMTGARFERFREATGAASALQSRTYQLMQIALTGVNPATIDVVAGVEELRELKLYDQPLYATLADLTAPLYADARSPTHSLVDHCDRLSRELRKWRKVHRGIVRDYLATRPQGTGGTDGAGYLKHAVDTTIAAAAGCQARLRARERQEWAAAGRPPVPAADQGHARPVLWAQN